MEDLGRRGFLLGAASALLAAGGRPVRAQSEAWRRFDPALRLLGGREPVPGGIAIDLPLVAEDGSSVPLGVAVADVSSDAVEAIHLFATGNPSPEILSLTPGRHLARAAFDTRVRLDGSQAVVAVAELADGSMRVAAREIRITASGCLMNDPTAADVELATRIRVPKTIAQGRAGEVLALVNHPMETGLRIDAAGAVVPQRIVSRLEVTLEGEPVLEARLFRSLAANPFLRFHLAGEQGGRLRFVWTEDTGRAATAEAEVQIV